MTAKGPADLVLSASVNNVVDNRLPTMVSATLGGSPGVHITEINGDNGGPKDFHSIPREGAYNHNVRGLNVSYTKPTGSTISNNMLYQSGGFMAVRWVFSGLLQPKRAALIHLDMAEIWQIL